MSKFIIIVAVSQNNVIGNKNSLPWPKVKEDLEHFRLTTTGQSVLMGRKTFESIGKPLPNRKNYVLSSQNITISGITLIKNIKEAENLEEEIIYIIGGSKIYEQFIPLAQEIIISRLPFSSKGDTFFPEINKNDWQLKESIKIPLSDFNNKIMVIEKLVRKF